MQGSYRDTMEKFSGKQKDNSKRLDNKISRKMRDNRRQRHQESE